MFVPQYLRELTCSLILAGSFEWGGQNFSDTAEEVSFELEGDDNLPILRAKLANSEGERLDADVNLAERIGNDNGTFSFA